MQRVWSQTSNPFLQSTLIVGDKVSVRGEERQELSKGWRRIIWNEPSKCTKSKKEVIGCIICRQCQKQFCWECKIKHEEEHKKEQERTRKYNEVTNVEMTKKSLSKHPAPDRRGYFPEVSSDSEGGTHNKNRAVKIC